MLLVPNDENCELNDDLKRVADHAFGAFMQTIDPLLQRQFFLDGFPEKLCHYTDFRGLKGILETGVLWATYTQTFNDGSEVDYGLRIVKNHVSNFSDREGAGRLAAALELSTQRT